MHAIRRDVFTYELFPLPGDPLVWDITRAKELVAEGRVIRRVPMDANGMREIAQNNDWNPAHLPNVDPALPGIAAPIIVPGIGTIYTLIDGTHRCVRALLEGRIFYADLLTDEAGRACLISGPQTAIP